MSKIKNGGLDQYGAEAFEQQQFGTAGVEGVKHTRIIRAHFNDKLLTITSIRVDFVVSVAVVSRHHTGDDGRVSYAAEAIVVQVRLRALPVLSPAACDGLPQICTMNGRRQVLWWPGKHQRQATSHRAGKHRAERGNSAADEGQCHTKHARR